MSLTEKETEQAKTIHLAREARADIHAELPYNYPDAIKKERRYFLVKEIVEETLTPTAAVEKRYWKPEHSQRVADAVLHIAKYADPSVNSHLGVHLLTSGIMARKIAEYVNLPAVNADAIEARALLHDVGTFIEPREYFRKDRIGRRMMIWGYDSDKEKVKRVKDQFLDKFPDISRILGIKRPTLFSANHASYIARILDVSDNLSKFGKDGNLFSEQTMEEYASAQPTRYSANSFWPSTNRGRLALNEEVKVRGEKKLRQKTAIELVLHEITWLESLGIDFDTLRREVAEEVQSPENQKWLLQFSEALQTLDITIDMELGKPPITTIVFDVGNVLLAAKDEDLITGMANQLHCSPKMITDFFTEYNASAMNGSLSEEAYLKLLYTRVGKEYPGSVEVARKPLEQPDIYTAMPGMQQILQELLSNPTISVVLQSDVIPSVKNVVLQKLLEFYARLNPERIHFSCDMKASKKDEKAPAYKWVIRTTQTTDPETMLVVDDNVGYVDTASSEYKMRRHHFRVGSNGDLPAVRFRKELELAGILI